MVKKRGLNVCFFKIKSSSSFVLDPLPQEDTEGKYILICSRIQFYTGRTTYRISFCVNLSLFVFNGGKLEILSKTYHSTDKNEDGA